MRDIPVAFRRLVLARAQGRCEYCRLPQLGQEATFHIDHVIPVAAGGATTSNNLALACVSCSLRKGASRSAPDPESGDDTPLFNPRKDDWSAHFRWDGVTIMGATAVGRTTVAAWS